MNRNNGVRPIIYQDVLKMPYPSPQSPKFAFYDRLTQAQPPRRTWADFFESLFTFSMGIGFGLLVIDLALQLIFYGYLQGPVPRPNIPGRRTHYDTLEIGHDADQDAITKAWRLKEWTLNPDTVGNTEDSRETYYWMQLAYVELSDPLARCYHDQYHGFIPRRFGKDDPCTKILTERAREARLKDRLYARVADLREQFLFANATRDKVYETWGEWRDNMAEKKRQWYEYGDLLGGIQRFAKRIAAWPFIALGFLFGAPGAAD